MKAPFRHIKGIASGSHGASEKIRLPFHTAKCGQGTVDNMILSMRHDADCLCYGHRQAFEESVNVIKSTTFLCLQAFHKLADSLFHASCIRCIKTLLILWWARISIPIIMLFL